MATNAELQEEVKQKNVRIRDLETEIKALKEENEHLRNLPSAAPKAPVMGGFRVDTKNPRYNGTTMGIQFRKGVALVPADPKFEHILLDMKNDFGYEITSVSDIGLLPTEEQEQVQRSLVDVLSVPEYR